MSQSSKRRGHAAIHPFLVLLLLLAPTVASHAQDALTPGAFHEDPATLHSLGFRWIVSGDDDKDAVATLEYRVSGSPSWEEGLRLLRIHGEPAGVDGFVTGNLFAGSLMGLEAGTSYDLRVTLSDPDGITGSSVHGFTQATRALPNHYPSGATLHVYTSCAGAVEQPCYTSLVSAAQDADPGDTVLIHEGTYLYSGAIDLRFLSGRATTPTKPIVFRGVDRDAVVLDRGFASNSTSSTSFIRVQGTRHLHFVDFTVANAGMAFSAANAEGLVVRRLLMNRVWSGVYGSDNTGATERDWWIADNEIIGRNTVWYPYSSQSLSLSHTGIMVYGKGHVIEHNKVGQFWDCIAHADTGGGQVTNTTVDWRDPPSLNIDIESNELYECFDDGIEADYGYHNIRIMRNRITNAHTALSVQPFYGGPVYFVRNVADNIEANSFKWHNQPAGIEAYNNTFIVSEASWDSAAGFVNVRVKNNLLLGPDGAGRYQVYTGAARHPLNVLDHNAYTDVSSGDLIRWNRAPYLQNDVARYRNLGAFYSGEGFEQHGLIVNYSIFESAGEAPGEGSTYAPGQQNLTLRSGAIVRDAGGLIPNVTDGFEGSAPDIGAYEYGAAVPSYGPRPAGPGSPLPEARCDGIDDDGDGTVDDGCDDDADGYCDAALELVGAPDVCPYGGGDCDDEQQSIHPDAIEACDGIDNDCDAGTPDGALPEVGDTLSVSYDGSDLEFHWTDTPWVDEYAVYCDTAPNGSFGLEEGRSASGTLGLRVAPRAGEVHYYLVAVRAPGCDAGPLR